MAEPGVAARRRCICGRVRERWRWAARREVVRGRDREVAQAREH